jgi:hypothetical protein
VSLGYTVDKGTLDAKAAQAALELRAAFEKSNIIANYLALFPFTAPAPDPIIANLGYTADEAAALRTVFSGFDSAYTTLAFNFATARQITGLE